MEKVLVVGGRKSGLFAALLAKKLGYSVFLTENSVNEEVLKNVNVLKENGIDYEIGKHSFGLFKSFDFAVLSPGVPLGSEIVLSLERDGIPFIGETEFAYRSSPETEIVAVTGSNGKSTTTSLIGHILELFDGSTITGGNLGNPYSELLLNMPSPHFAVLETSCFQLETIEKYRPKVAVFLNIMENHLDRYKTIDEYVSVKKRIFENQDANDFAVLNYDDRIVSDFSKSIRSKTYFYSLYQEVPVGAYFEGGNIYVVDSKSKLLLTDVSKIKLRGMHNVSNVLAAVVAASVLKVPNEVVIKGIETFRGLPHRLEEVRTIDGVLYVNDSKSTTPDSTIKALESFNAPIILIAGGSSKNNDFTNLSQYFSGRVKKLILLGDTARAIGDAAVRAGFGNFVIVNSLENAVKKAKAISSSGDVVLLSPACASFDMFNDFEHRGETFKQIVNKL
ncbi:MAG: UDP-N-acetylmuramoyl-L-alanine--D-glutamate ligase [Caldisericaceae bacterium]